MTSLIADEDEPTASFVGGLANRIKWSVVVPWALALLSGYGVVYHRFLAIEEAKVQTSQEMRELRREVQELQSEVRVLTAIVERVEANQQVDRARRR